MKLFEFWKNREIAIMTECFTMSGMISCRSGYLKTLKKKGKKKFECQMHKSEVLGGLIWLWIDKKKLQNSQKLAVFLQKEACRFK